MESISEIAWSIMDDRNMGLSDAAYEIALRTNSYEAQLSVVDFIYKYRPELAYNIVCQLFKNAHLNDL